MPSIKSNANFNNLAGDSAPSLIDDEYKAYRAAWEENPRNFILRDFPLHLDLEATNRCNLRCTFCDKLPYWTKDQMGDMDFGLYKRIVDEGAEHRLWGVKLSYRGEPLIHKEIVQMVDYARKKGVIDVYFNTNAMLLTEEKSRGFIEAGLNRISISVEGTDPLKFREARIGADFDTIKRNLDTLIRIREQNHVDYPKIRVQTVKLPDIDLQDYARYWSNFADEVAAIDYKDSEDRVTGIESEFACPQLWQRMTVEWDGSVFPCNNDDLRLLKLGNAKEDSIFELWNSELARNLRTMHQAGKANAIDACNGCPWRTAQLEKLNGLGR